MNAISPFFGLAGAFAFFFGGVGGVGRSASIASSFAIAFGACFLCAPGEIVSSPFKMRSAYSIALTFAALTSATTAPDLSLTPDDTP